MNFIERLIGWLRLPFDSLFSENGYLGAIWHESGRNQSLMLGLPSILFAIVGVLLLAFAQFGVSGNLEAKYKSWLQLSANRKEELSKELQRIIKMKLASQQTQQNTTIDDLIPADDQLRVDLKKAQEEERVYLQKLNSINPTENEYLFRLAKVTIGSAISPVDSDLGLAMMKRIAPTSEPGYLPAHLYLADYHALMSNREPARVKDHIKQLTRHLNLILVREPNHDVALKRLSLIYYQQGKYREAYPLFYRLFENDPQNFKPVVDINDRLKRTSENMPILRVATDYLTRRLREVSHDDDERTTLLKQICDCYRIQDRHEDCEKLLLSEKEIYSQSQEDASRLLWVEKLLASNYLSWSLRFRGEDLELETKRLEFMKKAYFYDPKNAEGLRMLTRMATSSNPSIAKQAIEIYDAEKQEVRPALVINELGIFALSRSDYDEALKLFQQAMKASPRNPEILNNLAYTYLKCSNPKPKDSLSYINRAIRFTPASRINTYRTNFLDTRARAYMQLGQYTSAIADLTHAWNDRKDNVEIVQAIIDCYEAAQLDGADIWRQRLDQLKQKQQAELLEQQNQSNENQQGALASPDKNSIELIGR
ncbi:MAG: tetratricopeptide repeat protein [Planctomycetota bacterium]